MPTINNEVVTMFNQFIILPNITYNPVESVTCCPTCYLLNVTYLYIHILISFDINIEKKNDEFFD